MEKLHLETKEDPSFSKIEEQEVRMNEHVRKQQD